MIWSLDCFSAFYRKVLLRLDFAVDLSGSLHKSTDFLTAVKSQFLSSVVSFKELR